MLCCVSKVRPKEVGAGDHIFTVLVLLYGASDSKGNIKLSAVEKRIRLNCSRCSSVRFLQNNNLNLHADFLQSQLLRHKEIVWTKPASLPSANDTEEKLPSSCRNSVQGKTLIVDDRGYVCPRSALQQNGCCSDIGKRKLYPCSSCLPNRCCAVYEYCVACCLHPDMVSYTNRQYIS